jgi:hypothetical protein
MYVCMRARVRNAYACAYRRAYEKTASVTLGLSSLARAFTAWREVRRKIGWHRLQQRFCRFSHGNANPKARQAKLLPFFLLEIVILLRRSGECAANVKYIRGESPFVI